MENSSNYEIELQKARNLVDRGEYVCAYNTLKNLESLTLDSDVSSSISEIKKRISTEIKEKFGLRPWALDKGLDSEPDANAYHERALRELEKAVQYEREGKLLEAARFYAGACTGFLYSGEKEEAKKLYDEKRHLFEKFCLEI